VNGGGAGLIEMISREDLIIIGGLFAGIPSTRHSLNDKKILRKKRRIKEM